MFINDDHRTIGFTYDSLKIGTSRIRGQSRLKTQVERSFSYLLSPMKFIVRKQIQFQKKKVHKRASTQKLEQQPVKSKSPKDISKEQLAMKSFTLNLNHSEKETNKSVNLRIPEYLWDQKYHKHNIRNKKLKIKDKPLKTQTIRGISDYNYKSVNFEVDKLGIKMPIYDRYAESKRINNQSVSLKTKANDTIIRTHRSISKKPDYKDIRKTLVEQIRPWENIYEDSMLY